MIVILLGWLVLANFLPSLPLGFADIPSADKMCPRKTMLHWKKWHFFSLIFKLNSSSHLNTN